MRRKLRQFFPTLNPDTNIGCNNPIVTFRRPKEDRRRRSVSLILQPKQAAHSPTIFDHTDASGICRDPNATLRRRRYRHHVFTTARAFARKFNGSEDFSILAQHSQVIVRNNPKTIIHINRQCDQIVIRQRTVNPAHPPPKAETFAVVAGQAVGGRQPDVPLPIDGEVVDHRRQTVLGAEAYEARLGRWQGRTRSCRVRRENGQQRTEAGHDGPPTRDPPAQACAARPPAADSPPEHHPPNRTWARAAMLRCISVRAYPAASS